MLQNYMTHKEPKKVTNSQGEKKQLTDINPKTTQT